MGTGGSQGSSLLRALGSDLRYQRHRGLMTDAVMSAWSCGLSQASHLAFVCLDSLHRGLCLEFLPGQSH